MELIALFMMIYVGIRLIKENMAKIARLNKYMCFKFMYPESVGNKKFNEYLKKLINTDFPELPENKKLEYVVARMRTMNFPDGIKVVYKGDVLEV